MHMASNQKSVIAAVTSGPRPASCSGTGCASMSRWMWRLRDLVATTPGSWPPRRGAHAIPMCVLHLLLITTSLSHLFTAASGTGSQAEEARNFILERVNDAAALAGNATKNWEQVWILAPNIDCSDTASVEFRTTCKTDCSLGECVQLTEDQLKSLSCVYFDNSLNLTGCGYGVTTTGGPSNCKSYAIQADYNRSFVSFPNYTVVTSTPSEVELSICAQKELDIEFKNLNPLNSALPSSSVNPYYSQMYFASVDGSYRTYPARPPRQNCTSQKSFDARQRSWYMSAVSGVHELAIVLDSGYSMSQPQVSLTDSDSRFNVARSIIADVLETLILGSRVAIISFDDQSSKNVTAIADTRDANHTGSSSHLSVQKRNELLQFVQDATPPSQLGGPSNISLGLETALDMWGNSSSNAGDLGGPMMKVIMLFTDGQSNSMSVDTLGQRIKDENVTVFVYQLGSGKVSPLLTTVADHVHLEAIKDVTGNTLYQIRSYFSFLALCRERAAQGNSSQLAFWQPVYTDRDILGEVITISYPAFSENFCELIGVIGIDIQVTNFYLEEPINDAILDLPTASTPFTFGPGIAYPCQGLNRPAAPPILDCFGTEVGGICETPGQSNPQLADRRNQLCCELGTCPAPAAPPPAETNGPEPEGSNVPPEPGPRDSLSPSAGKSKSTSIIVGCVVGGVGALAIVIFLYVRCLRDKCVEASFGTPPPRPPARPDQSPGPASGNYSSSSDTALKL